MKKDDDVEMMTLTPSGPTVVTGLGAAAAALVLRKLREESPVTVWTSVVAGPTVKDDEEEDGVGTSDS